MNKGLGNSILTVLLGAGSVLLARPLGAEPLQVSHSLYSDGVSDTVLARALPVPAPVEYDIAGQLIWLTQQAQQFGFADLDELLEESPHLFTQLAVDWRQAHPLLMAA